MIQCQPLFQKKTVTLLREDYGFKGVIATDDLNMGAISNQFPYHDALKLAINAGVDMIIIGNNGQKYIPSLIENTIAHIYEMVNNGVISEERINEAYNKIKVRTPRYPPRPPQPLTPPPKRPLNFM